MVEQAYIMSVVFVCQEAMSGVPGPVFIEFPIDTLYDIGEVR